MSKQVIHTTEAPEAVGPYSQATVAGEFVFCSGQVALDPASGELIDGSIAEQTGRCLQSLKAVLSAAGSSLDKVVKVTAFLTDMGDFAEFNGAYEQFFPGEAPARVTVGVAALPKGAQVEVECVALR